MIFNTKLIRYLAEGETTDDSVRELIRSELERLMNDLLKMQMTDLLNYKKYERSGFNGDNSQNGSYERNMNTVHSEFHLTIPRDRNGEFESLVVPKYERWDTRTEDIVVKLIQIGLTNAEISEIVECLYEKKYSRGAISNITEQIIVNVEVFKARRLNAG